MSEERQSFDLFSPSLVIGSISIYFWTIRHSSILSGDSWSFADDQLNFHDNKPLYNLLRKTTSHDLANVLRWLCLASAIRKSKHGCLLVYFFPEVKGSVSSCRRWLSVWWVSTGWCSIDQWLLHLGRCRHFRSHSHAYNLSRGDISILTFNCHFLLHVSNVYKSSQEKAQMTTPHCNHSHLHAVHPLHASQLPNLLKSILHMSLLYLLISLHYQLWTRLRVLGERGTLQTLSLRRWQATSTLHDSVGFPHSLVGSL